MPLTTVEWAAITNRLTELEEFLHKQRICALAVRHDADAAVLEGAMTRVISVHALARLMALEPGDLGAGDN